MLQRVQQQPTRPQQQRRYPRQVRFGDQPQPRQRQAEPVRPQRMPLAQAVGIAEAEFNHKIRFPARYGLTPDQVRDMRANYDRHVSEHPEVVAARGGRQ